MHRVVALCLEGIVPFDLAAPAQVLFSAGDAEGRPLYRFSTCSPDGAEVATTAGFRMAPGGGLELLADADTVLVPGYADLFARPPDAAVDALRAAGRGARVVSVCTGAFALAHAGLLDGRRATTHWAWTGELAARFPQVAVEPESLYVDEGEVMTSAGLSAGIDLALHLVRKDFGAAVGARAARRMVAPPHREGGQAQFIEGPRRAAADGSLEPTRRWAAERLREPLDVAAMARHAAVSPRTFARRFLQETGTTPHRWLLSRRVLEARRLLEETDEPIEQVASRSGFGSAASLRQHFRRETATSPTAYRRSFRAAT
jgi:AraC family transcriptional activator FtrA